MIGGGGEKKTLRLVAQYGDACNLFVHLGKEELVRKLDILKEHCKDVGRKYDDIEKTALDHILPDFNPKEVIDTCKQMKELGFDQLIFGIRNIEDIEPLKIFGEKIIPEVSKL